MGDSNNYHEYKRQQPNNSQLFVLSGFDGVNHSPHKPIKKKMETKLILTLFNFGYGLITLLNIENVKGWMLFAVGIVYGIARVAFYIIEKNQKRRLTELDIQERQQRVAGIRNTP